MESLPILAARRLAEKGANYQAICVDTKWYPVANIQSMDDKIACWDWSSGYKTLRFIAPEAITVQENAAFHRDVVADVREELADIYNMLMLMQQKACRSAAPLHSEQEARYAFQRMQEMTLQLDEKLLRTASTLARGFSTDEYPVER